MPFDQFKILPDQSSSAAASASWRDDLITFALLTALVTAMFAPVFFSGRLLAPDDGIYQNLPNFFGARTLWTTYLCAGFPLVADPLVQFFYPPAIIFAHLPAGWNLYVLLGYVLAGFFLYKYMLVLTNSWYSSFMAALAFTFSGYLLSEVNHMHVVHNAFWLTFLLLAFENLARRLTVKWFVSASLAVTLMIFCGHMQHSCYTLALCFFYILLRGFCHRPLASAEQRKYFMCCGTTLFLGLAMASVQLLPTKELASFSGRANFSFQDFLAFSLMPLQATGLYFPYLFGGASGGIINIPSFAAFAADTSFVYLGFIPMVLAAAVMSVRKNVLIWFWLAIGVVAFLLSFGDATPLGWLVYHIPQYGSFRCLHRTLLYSALATAILLGLATAACLKGELKGRALTNSLFLNACCLIVILVGATTVQSALVTQAVSKGIANFSVFPWANAALGLQCLYFALSAAAVIYFWKYAGVAGQKLLWAKIFLAFVLCLDLATTGWYAGESRWRLSSPAAASLQPVATVSSLAPLLEKNHQRILAVRGASGTPDEIPCNISRLWQVDSASGYEPLIFSRYSQLLNMTEGGFLRVPWNYTAADRCFDILAIRYATCAGGDERLLSLKDADGKAIWKKMADSGEASIFENLRAMPRAWLVSDVKTMSAAQVLTTIKTSRMPDGQVFNPANTALVDHELVDHDLVRYATKDEIGPLKSKMSFVTVEADRISLKIDASRSAFLILSDSQYLGWTVKVNQKSVEAHGCDYVLRGVFVPAGKSKVEFIYQPPMFKLGLIISIGALVALLSLAGWWRWNRQSSIATS